MLAGPFNTTRSQCFARSFCNAFSRGFAASSANPTTHRGPRSSDGGRPSPFAAPSEASTSSVSISSIETGPPSFFSFPGTRTAGR